MLLGDNCKTRVTVACFPFLVLCSLSKILINLQLWYQSIVQSWFVNSTLNVFAAGWEGGVRSQAEGSGEGVHADRDEAVPGGWWSPTWCWGLPGRWFHWSRRCSSGSWTRRRWRTNHRGSRLKLWSTPDPELQRWMRCGRAISRIHLLWWTTAKITMQQKMIQHIKHQTHNTRHHTDTTPHGHDTTRTRHHTDTTPHGHDTTRTRHHTDTTPHGQHYRCTPTQHKHPMMDTIPKTF